MADSDAPDFTIASYNVFLRPRYPFVADGQQARSRRLPKWLCSPSFDVLALCELFDRRARDELLGRLASDYPHRTRLLGADSGGWRLNGGVMLLSRWPIEREQQALFRVAAYDDRLVNKGVCYARVRKNGRPIHVFAAHANARAGASAVRSRQFRILRDFVRRCAIPSSEPVLIVGDLNVHRGRRQEHAEMLVTLNARSAEINAHRYSYDPHHNELAEGSTRLHLDYVLYSLDHRPPRRCESQVHHVTCSPRWRLLPFLRSYRDLSDHYPVVGRFWF